MPRFLRYGYSRLGTRYLKLALFLQFQFAHVVVLGGLGLLTLYQPLSLHRFLRLLVAAEVLIAIDNALINCDGYWIRASDYSILLDEAGKLLLQH